MNSTVESHDQQEGLTKRSDESGYIAVVTALVITVLLFVIGIAVDFAFWHSRSTTLQRAADAAALAGVTAAPNRLKEIQIAEESLAKNGIVNGVNGVTVGIALEPGTANRLRVTVTDSEVPGFFTRWFRESPTIQRTSAAQYIQKISLGSALNALGTGSQAGMTPNGATQDFWLAVSGACTAKEDGDRLLSLADGNRKANSDEYVCDQRTVPHPDISNAHVNADYDPAGYSYYVTVPCPGDEVEGECPLTATSTGQPITIEAFDPTYSPNSGDPTDFRVDRKALASAAHPAWNSTTLNTVFEVYAPDATPDDYTDDTASLLTSQSFGTCETTDVVNCPDAWRPIAVIPAGSPGGRYRIQVYTRQDDPNSFGHNVFALRARLGGAFSICSTVPTSPAYLSYCPSIAGDESMSVFANKSGAVAEMYLARLAPAADYRGKRVRILLWDPGEGAKQIQILPPGSTTPVQFTYRTWDPGLKRLDGTPLVDKAEGWPTEIGPTDTLTVGDPNPVAGGGYPQWTFDSRYSPSRYNDRMVAIELTVPRTYGRDSVGSPIPLPDEGWWKIRYISDTGVVQDRTTWSVTLAGDPVHLVGNNG